MKKYYVEFGKSEKENPLTSVFQEAETEAEAREKAEKWICSKENQKRLGWDNVKIIRIEEHQEA